MLKQNQYKVIGFAVLFLFCPCMASASYNYKHLCQMAILSKKRVLAKQSARATISSVL